MKIMKRNIFAYLIIGLLVLSGCDYNEKNFEGFNDNPITDVVNYAGDYTGTYPSDGYFTNRANLASAVTTMLKDMFPYCDAGSTAKINVQFGTVTQDFQPADVSYELTPDDYDTMGTESGQPGRYDNFDSKMDIEAYLKDFLNVMYSDLAVNKTITISYKYYSGGTTTQTMTFQKSASDWNVIELVAFAPDETYTLTTEDYDSMGTSSGQPGRYDNFDVNMDINMYITNFLRITFPYTATGETMAVIYKYYADRITSDVTRIYKYDGSSWAEYNPYAEITNVTTMVAEMSFDGTTWELDRLMGGTATYTMVKADYQYLVDWVAINKPAFMSTQNDQEEYYFGSSAKYENINNQYNTWKSYYNVDGYLDGMSNEQIQTVMSDRMEEAFITLLLPEWVETPDDGLSYVCVYTIYGGLGNGNYSMSFIYNKNEDTFEYVAGPTKL